MNHDSMEKDTDDLTTIAQEGKYLTFELGHEEYGVEILKVREIIGLMEITDVPQTPGFIQGIINLRGRVIPVVNLRRRFGMDEVNAAKENCIIIIDLNDSLIGALVDSVSEVQNIGSDQIEPAPSFGNTVSTNYITGIGKINGKVNILLDIGKVLSPEELGFVSVIGAVEPD